MLITADFSESKLLVKEIDAPKLQVLKEYCHFQVCYINKQGQRDPIVSKMGKISPMGKR